MRTNNRFRGTSRCVVGLSVFATRTNNRQGCRRGSTATECSGVMTLRLVESENLISQYLISFAKLACMYMYVCICKCLCKYVCIHLYITVFVVAIA